VAGEKVGVKGFIPSPLDQNPCAQRRRPIDMILQG
jgi:hypothetical protein